MKYKIKIQTYCYNRGLGDSKNQITDTNLSYLIIKISEQAYF